MYLSAPPHTRSAHAQAPGLRALCAGVLLAAGEEGVSLSNYWIRYRRLYAGHAQPVYVVAKPRFGSAAAMRKPDKRFAVGTWKPDVTVRALLREYGTSLSDFLGSIAGVEFDRGGRYGARALMYRASPSADAEDGAAEPPPRVSSSTDDAATADLHGDGRGGTTSHHHHR